MPNVYAAVYSAILPQAAQVVDDLVVLNVGDGSCVAGVVWCELDETRLVEPNCAGAIEAFLVGLDQRFAVGGNSVIDAMAFQLSSLATFKTVRPVPTWIVAHLAARAVKRQFFAAIR